jgi:hypothetical protein
MDETIPLKLQGDGLIDEYGEITNGQKTKFEVEVAEGYLLSDIAARIPDDWSIETNNNGSANIWPPQASVYVASNEGKSRTDRT